jgi:hypothetical protein
VLSLVGKAGGSLEEQAGDGGWLPLHFAAYEGHSLAVQWLLQSGAPAHARNREGRAAREVAHTRGHSHIVALIDGLAGPPPPSVHEREAAAQQQQQQQQQQACSARGSGGGGSIWDAAAAAAERQPVQQQLLRPLAPTPPPEQQGRPPGAGFHLPITSPRLP